MPDTISDCHIKLKDLNDLQKKAILLVEQKPQLNQIVSLKHLGFLIEKKSSFSSLAIDQKISKAFFVLF